MEYITKYRNTVQDLKHNQRQIYLEKDAKAALSFEHEGSTPNIYSTIDMPLEPNGAETWTGLVVPLPEQTIKPGMIDHSAKLVSETTFLECEFKIDGMSFT